MQFLVTGGAGFIGSHLCERLIKEGHAVVCLDDFNDYYDPAIKEENLRFCLEQRDFKLIRGDILDWDLLAGIFQKNTFDCVVHLAARAGVRPSIQQPRLYQKVNVEGTVNILEMGVRHRIPKTVIASSSSVYGGNTKIPFSEDDPVNRPVSPYAATKRACELMACTYHALYQMPVTMLRFFTVYGPRQRPDMAIRKFTELIVKGKEVPLYGDGTTRRDYTYITDIIDGILRSIDRCKEYHIYNLGESQTITLRDLIGQIEKALNKAAKIKTLPMQPGDVLVTYADVEKARRELGYNPQVPVQQGIGMFVDWYKKTFG